ncbi:MAG: 3-oxoacyl-ACP reductase FabG [Acetobacter papayae]|uniref:3-oxoacyl-ACP reductase FabG n=1 Tax=Acetobacter papayae TaxID=1076592 RepID=UPI0039EAA8C8
MFRSLEGRTVLVTGGTRGIGRGIAERFGQVGCQVAVVSRKAEDAQAVAAAIGPKALGFGVDVSSGAACETLVEQVVNAFGSVDILCANAGIFPSATLETMTEEDFDHIMAVNLRSLFTCTRAVLPVMKKKGWGRIVATSSVTGPITGFPGWAHYGASKAGQMGFLRTAAIELAPHGITINAVMPGNIRTEGLDGLGDDYLSAMEASIPMGRLGSVMDIANTALFLASEEAGYITGQGIVVDGGQVLPESAMALPQQP